MEVKRLINLLKEFSQGYCDEGQSMENCAKCEMSDLCQTVYLVSKCLNGEMTEGRMVEEINFDYMAKKMNE